MKLKLREKDVDLARRFGMPPAIEMCAPFSIEDRVKTFKTSSYMVKKKTINAERQIEFINRVYNDPFHGPYLYCISGMPHDEQAHLIAACLFVKALKVANSAAQFPQWVAASLENKLNVSSPSLLVVSKLNIDSTKIKIEKVRDLLYRNRGIPRILVVSGADPLAFMHEKIGMQFHGCTFVQSKTYTNKHGQPKTDTAQKTVKRL